MEYRKCIKDCVPQITQGYRKSMFADRNPLFHSFVRRAMCFMHLRFNALQLFVCFLFESLFLTFVFPLITLHLKSKTGHEK